MPGRAEEVSHPLANILRWAVAAGAMGFPVNIAFHNLAVSVTVELVRRLIAWIGGPHVHFVYGRKDFHQLQKDFPSFGLILVIDPEQLRDICWLSIERATKSGTQARPAPAVVSVHSELVRPDIPGATLDLHGYSPETRLLEAWLEHGRPWNPLSLDSVPAAVRFNDPLSRLFLHQEFDNAEAPIGLGDRSIVRSLLVGAALVRAAPGILDERPLIVEIEDYRSVRLALQLAATQPAGSAFNPLVLAMVHRVNAWLLMRAEQAGAMVTRADARVGVIEKSPGITRREIADLGNTRGATVRSLLDHLLQQGQEGQRIIRSIGITRVTRDPADLPTNSTELARLLVPWTLKQIRTSFDFLHANGLISAERQAANGPWFYRLPEVLANPNSPFRALPSPEDLERTGPPA